MEPSGMPEAAGGRPRASSLQSGFRSLPVGEGLVAIGTVLFVLAGFLTFDVYDDAGQHEVTRGWSTGYNGAAAPLFAIAILFGLLTLVGILTKRGAPRSVRLGTAIIGAVFASLVVVLLLAGMFTKVEDHAAGGGLVAAAFAAFVVLMGTLSFDVGHVAGRESSRGSIEATALPGDVPDASPRIRLSAAESIASIALVVFLLMGPLVFAHKLLGGLASASFDLWVIATGTLVPVLGCETLARRRRWRGRCAAFAAIAAVVSALVCLAYAADPPRAYSEHVSRVATASAATIMLVVAVCACLAFVSALRMSERSEPR